MASGVEQGIGSGVGLSVDAVSRLKPGEVLVVGDAMLDRYWLGEVERISPEAPVPVMRVGDEEERVGGAANVASNIAALSGKARLLSVVGDDEDGRRLASLLRQTGIQPLLITCADMRTTTKLRMIGRNQQLLRADFEGEPGEASLHACAQRFEEELPSAGAVVFSDYGKGALADIHQMIKAAKSAGVPVLVDPKGSDFSPYRGADLLTPNLAEFQVVAGPCWEIDEIQKQAEALIRELDLGALLVTLSERGMVLCRLGEPPLVQSARAREVYDVTGAGDTVIGVSGLAVAAGFGLDEAVALANHAAGIVVTKLGTATVSPDELAISLARAA